MYTIGVDLGGTNIAVGLVDENYKIVNRMSTPTDPERRFGTIMKDMGDIVNKLIKESGITLQDVKYIGIGAPGVLDNEKGTVTDNSNIHWENFPIRSELQKYVDKPVYLGNDANVAAWAEYVSGCAKGVKNFIMLTLGTGVGGGIIINGKLITGSHNIAAEIGHITYKAGGNQCGCGNKGCVEAYCSATALIKAAVKDLDKHPDSVIAKAEKVNARVVVDAAREGDEYGTMLFEQYTDDLAQVIASIINFLDPDIIALGGGVANAGEFLLKPVREKLKSYVTFASMLATEVLQAEMGNDAGIIGAALLGE
ncbi:MAG: ROK family protein [Clostridia bacterium]|nr:ROK family protein [Clostridia bacterium]